MKRNPSWSLSGSLTDELAELRGLDATALKQRWRVLYRTDAPAHIGQALLLQAIAYRLQERALGGLKRSTRRLLERIAEDNVRRRSPTETPTTGVTPGTVLIREWGAPTHLRLALCRLHQGCAIAVLSMIRTHPQVAHRAGSTPSPSV